jgi:patatin-like phospholipase/acyl hydrolase
VLAHLEAHTKRPLARSFDLIAGTSIGGILALALAFEIPMALAVEIFRRRGPEIFTRKSLCGFVSAKYSQIPLKQTIEEILRTVATTSIQSSRLH